MLTKKASTSSMVDDFFYLKKEEKNWNKMLGADFSFILWFSLNKPKNNQNLSKIEYFI